MLLHLVIIPVHLHEIALTALLFQKSGDKTA